MIASEVPDPKPVLAAGAVYGADNGMLICRGCAGSTARYTGHDLSGQPLWRINLKDMRAWPADLPPLGCEGGCITLSAIAGPDGWPMPTGRSA